MADSKREKIIQALVAALRQITVSNGYETNIGKNVYRGLPHNANNDSLPFVFILENIETIDSEISMGFDHHHLEIEIHGRSDFNPGDAWQPETLKMLADTTKAIGQDPTLGGLAIDIMLESQKVGQEEDQLTIAGVESRMTIHYRTSHLNPYS